MEISDRLLCLFTGRVERSDDGHVIAIPEGELARGDIDANTSYSIAILDGSRSDGNASSRSSRREQVQEPPVAEGERRDVEIEDIGEQGDGIARVERGYVIIVPDTEEGERVNVEITEVRENVSFAEVVERYDVVG